MSRYWLDNFWRRIFLKEIRSQFAVPMDVVQDAKGPFIFIENIYRDFNPSVADE